MSFINLYDSHVHSDNSPDGRSSVTFLCENAVAKGLRGISITDHCEVDFIDEGRYKTTIKQSTFESLKAKAVFRGNLIVSTGIELGQPTSNIAEAEKMLKSHNFDFVLGSMHNAKDGIDYYCRDYKNIDAEAMLRGYFNDVLEMCRWNGFDSLAHLTYPVRYIQGRDGIAVDLAKFNDITDEILLTLVKNEKALEINSSGYRQKLNGPMPPPDYVKRFKELGGKYVTIGSDAHNTEDLGADIGRAMLVAQKAGFMQFAIYIGRTPMLIDIK